MDEGSSEKHARQMTSEEIKHTGYMPNPDMPPTQARPMNSKEKSQIPSRKLREADRRQSFRKTAAEVGTVAVIVAAPAIGHGAVSTASGVLETGRNVASWISNRINTAEPSAVLSEQSARDNASFKAGRGGFVKSPTPTPTNLPNSSGTK